MGMNQPSVNTGRAQATGNKRNETALQPGPGLRLYALAPLSAAIALEFC